MRRLVGLVLAVTALLVAAIALEHGRAGRTLERAQARTAALGLRLDEAALDSRMTEVELEALRAAWAVCKSIATDTDHRFAGDAGRRARTLEELRPYLQVVAWDSSATLMEAAERIIELGVTTPGGVEVWDQLLGHEPVLAGAPTLVELQTVPGDLAVNIAAAASEDASRGDLRGGWRRLVTAVRLLECDHHGELGELALTADAFEAMRGSCEALCALAPDASGRAELRSALCELDLIGLGRAALQRTAALQLHLAGTADSRLRTWTMGERGRALDLRAAAALHEAYAELVMATKGATRSEREGALDSLDRRIWHSQDFDALPFQLSSLSAWRQVETTAALAAQLADELSWPKDE